MLFLKAVRVQKFTVDSNAFQTLIALLPEECFHIHVVTAVPLFLYGSGC